MSERFESLGDFDAAAKAQELERFFQARLLVRELPKDGFPVVFTRGMAQVAMSPEARREIFERETEKPDWILAAPELVTLAERIETQVPDPERVYLFVGELISGSWEIRYGADLCHSLRGDDLAQVVSELLESIQA